MATLSQLLARIQQIDIAKEVEDAFNDNAWFAEDRNREQLMMGVGGERLMPDYSEKSVTKYGKPAGPIKLYETGAFYKGITYKAEDGIVKAFSTDEKNDFLEDMYDYYKPLKLIPENAFDMGNKLKYTMVKNISYKTGLK